MNQKGAILIITFILLLALLGITASFLWMAIHQGRHSGGLLDDEKAFYAAQLALRKGVWRLLNADPPENWHPDVPPPPGPPPWGPRVEKGLIDVGDNITASYLVTADRISFTGNRYRDFRFVATGTVHDVSRTVQRDYHVDLSSRSLTPMDNTWKEN
ncbi:MAG: hypothetical protein ABH845_01740 [Candidatus Omnitrophota bacterium]